MALVELRNRGIKYLVSQNCDGLHRKTGILPVSIITYTDIDLLILILASPISGQDI
jgi:hypothetical protein